VRRAADAIGTSEPNAQARGGAIHRAEPSFIRATSRFAASRFAMRADVGTLHPTPHASIAAGGSPMKTDQMLTIATLVAIVLATVHLADDVVHGFEPGGFTTLRAILLFAVWLCGALLLPGRRSGYCILILGSLLAIVMPIAHTLGKGLGGAVAHSSGGLFFIWTLYALGVTGIFSLILSVDGLWRVRRGKPDG
jgi:hypothetical protein